MILCETDVLEHLRMPSIPKKKWDGKSSFDSGVAVTRLISGDNFAYAIATYNAEVDAMPRIKQTFCLEPFSEILDIYIVPAYMETNNIDDWDIDDASKDFAKQLVEEAKGLETSADEVEQPDNEWVFDNIHNMEEAEAWVRAYRKKHKIRGKMPNTEEKMKAYLYVVKSNIDKNKNK